MGKKGTKRKTKWRALPLGEEAGGSGNEDELLDEDQSTTSSLVGSQPTLINNANNNNYRRQSVYYKSTDKSFRQVKRFPYDRYRSKEPLVKLESKTFDEEEYTKITTPRQDVLFKKGYFAKKRESSVEEPAQNTGEMEGEEPMMDQIIITNGFVDERGHYLVNGNSYEIYDPYSNTVTVIVGPPPYANGVTQPVLAAVSCQPVPLTPVDWYPPGSDWPSQGSAWTPSFPGTPNPDALNSPDGAPNFTPPDAQISTLYGQPAYVIPSLPYGDSPLRNGGSPQTNDDSNAPTEAQNADDNKLNETRRKSGDDKPVETEATEPVQESENDVEPSAIAQENEVNTAPTSIPPTPPPPSINKPVSTEPKENGIILNGLIENQIKRVEKQSHSTQTNLETNDMTTMPGTEIPSKESHGTQTPPEETQLKSKDLNANSQEPSNKNVNGSTKTEWRAQGKYKEFSPKKHREEYSSKIYQQRTNFAVVKSPEKSDTSAMRVSYAKKAMTGLVNGNSKTANGMVNKSPVPNGQIPNGVTKAIHAKQNYEDKRSTNENLKNGFRYNNRHAGGKQTNDNSNRPNQKYRERKVQLKFDEEVEKKCEELTSQSEKSSTVSELSSPTELSSGQNTPPEKMIVRKMEQEINKSFEEKLNVRKMEQEITKSFEEKLRQNFAEEEKTEQNEMEKEEVLEEEEEEKNKKEKLEIKPVEEEKEKKVVKEGKKKKNKTKEKDKSKEVKNGKKKKKTEEAKEAKEKSESENSTEEIPFLTKKDLILGSWDKVEDDDFGPLLNGDEDILKTLGLNEDRLMFSKLPLHSDLLMMPPTFGWGRPKLKIEDIFAPPHFHSDLYTKRNITNMKSTKPEEFFASVVDGPVEKSEKKKETKKPNKVLEEGDTTASAKKTKSAPKSGKKKSADKKAETETKDGKFGIVEAVNTWLQEQEDTEKVLSVDTLERLTKEEEPKNGKSNPMHASSASETVPGEKSACIRVANVINDGFKHVDKEFGRKKTGRMYRSSSWDAKLSDVRIKKHFKFLTDSASFCQDLISDVRNGLPARNEYATEELCDPKQIVSKYYTLAPNGRTGRARTESDSENEVFDALEYKFLTRENHESESKSPDGTGNASITDSGVHSDMESSEDPVTEHTKEPACKLQ